MHLAKLNMTDGHYHDSEELAYLLEKLTENEKTKVKFTQIFNLLAACKSNNLDLETALSSLTVQFPREPHADAHIFLWKTTNGSSSLYSASHQSQLRWGSGAAEINGKVFIFGGRSYDNKSKNSLHSFDLQSDWLSAVKSTAPPRPREGHSVTAFDNSLIVFGGCEGNQDEAPPFNDVSVLNLCNRVWRRPIATGKIPKWRDGHAAGLIRSQLLIYGGCAMNTIWSDMHTLDLERFEWNPVEQRGDVPGQRESMGCTVVSDKMFVFGGNTNDSTEGDEYINDLTEIRLTGHVAHCRLIKPGGHLPLRRHSLSLSNMKNRYLVLFGGETYSSKLNDVWIFDLAANMWREIKVQNEIPPRMAHVAWCHKSALYVYGGMNSENRALNDIAVLTFKAPTQENDKKTRLRTKNEREICALSRNLGFADLGIPNCALCGHSNYVCDLARNFPETVVSSYNFYWKVQIPYNIVQGMVNEFNDELAALLRLSELMGEGTIRINSLGKMLFRGSNLAKDVPPPADLAALCEESESDFRKSKLENSGIILESEMLSIEISNANLLLSPNEMSRICSGFSAGSLIIPLLRISNTIIMISRTDDYLTVALIQRTDRDIPVYFVVFNNDHVPVFPSNEVFYPNLREILNKGHLNLHTIQSYERGTSFIVYSKKIVEDNGELYFGSITLSAFLSYAIHIPASTSQFILNGTVISFFNLKEANITKNVNIPGLKYYMTYETDLLSTLIFYRNRLIYWEVKPPTSTKRKREHILTIIVKTNDKKVLSKRTGLLEWNHHTMKLFFIVEELANDYEKR